MADWYVYIVRCSDDTLYTGITTDLDRRLHEHNNTKKAARYTKNRRPVELVHHEPAEDRSSATQRENAIKAMPKETKEDLVSDAEVGENDE